MELYVFDFNFNRVGIVDDYVEIEFEHNYEKHSELILTVEASSRNAALLLDDSKELILTKSTDIHRGYVINTSQFDDGDGSRIEIIATSLSVLMSRRIIERQQHYSGNVEDVIKAFVNANAVNPANHNRIMPNLALGVNQGIYIEADEAYTDKYLDIALWEICNKYDMSYEILMDHDNKKFVFSTFQGVDRTTEQSINDHVIFSKEFDNVTRQSYVDDKSGYKNMAYVAGEGEGDNRTIIKLNDNLTGYERREVFFDARDLQSEADDTTIPPSEYDTLLESRGEARLAEYQRVRSFESDIDLHSQFIFNKDYFLGDKVTNRDDGLGIVMHSRVVVARETYNRAGYDLKIEFGSSIPTLIDKLKREVKK